MKYIVLNHKMNLENIDVDKYIPALKQVSFSPNKLVVCPTNIYIQRFIDNGFTVGAQNISFDTDGKLAQDYYVAFYVSEGIGTQPKITVTANGSDYEFKLSKTFYGPIGAIRTLTQATLGEPKALG